jgi:cytochrome b pre-mRNA-processing protein 3
VFDELWEDTSNRIRGQGINELSVNKYLKEVQGYSFRCCVELDHALSLHRTSTAALSSTSDGDRDEKLEDAEDKLVDDIAGVLWRLAYLRRDDIEIDHVLEFARYIRAEQQSLMTISKAAIFEARIQWGPLPWKADSSKAGMHCVV